MKALYNVNAKYRFMREKLVLC